MKSSARQSINLRSGPSTIYPIIGKAPYGTELTVVKYGKTWCFVKIGKVYGYMMTQFIARKK